MFNSVEQIRGIAITHSNFPATPTTKYIKVCFHWNDGCDEFMNLDDMNEWRHILAIILQERSPTETLLYLGHDNFSLRWVAKFILVKGTENINIFFKRRTMADIKEE